MSTQPLCISRKQVLNLLLTSALLAACSAPGQPTEPAEPAATQAPATAAVATEAPPPLATATSVPPTATAEPISLRVATITDETTLQPYTYVSGYPGWNMLSLVYDTLFILDTNSQPKPWVATGDQVSADGLVHTLTLRDDVRWHDGQPLTSADVKFAYEFYQANNHGRWTLPVRDIVSIEAPDDTTVIITLPAPDPSFPTRLLADVPIIPRHVWEGVTDPKTFENALGSGPFLLAEYEPEQFYRFTANPDYFAGKPGVAELLMPIIKDPTTVFAALKSGEIHATTRELAPELVAEFKADPTRRVLSGPGYATTLLQFNNERAPWDQAEVRQAVALAIDTRMLVDTVLLGLGTPGNPGWLHPAQPFHDPAIAATYDVERAKTLLDELGYTDTDGDGVREAAGQPMAPVLLVQANNPGRIRAAELIAAAMQEIGIAVTVSAEEGTSLTAKVWPDFDVAKGRDFDWTMFGWSAPVQIDPLRMATLVDSDVRYGTVNIGGYRSAEADALTAQLRVTTDPEAQIELVRKLEATIARDLPFVMLWYADLNYAFDPAVYDGWVFQMGQGVFNKLSFLPGVTP
ncbi:MAG: peptide ABC transporter substrate-binding protein [Anaerolineales bacterium]|nr:peptide ABC transporter substrate-binding protein [Anaerolineales bacterium]